MALSELVAEKSGGSYGQLTDGANAAGAWLAGAVPHRGPGGRKATVVGNNVATLTNVKGSENTADNDYLLL